MQYLINNLIANLGKIGLCVNVNKCTALSTSRVPAKKKLFIETKNLFRCADNWIPQIQVEDMDKGWWIKYPFIERKGALNTLQQNKKPEEQQ